MRSMQVCLRLRCTCQLLAMSFYLIAISCFLFAIPFSLLFPVICFLFPASYPIAFGLPATVPVLWSCCSWGAEYFLNSSIWGPKSFQNFPPNLHKIHPKRSQNPPTTVPKPSQNRPEPSFKTDHVKKSQKIDFRDFFSIFGSPEPPQIRPESQKIAKNY